MNETNRAILDAAAFVAERTDAAGVLLAAAMPEEARYLRQQLGRDRRVIAAAPADAPAEAYGEMELVSLPEVRLRRRGRAKVALLEALASGRVRAGERVVVVSGDAFDEYCRLDTVALVRLSEDSDAEDGGADTVLRGLAEVADPAAFDALLGLCVELGHEGREGKRVGLIATLGDHEAVMKRSRAAVLNPFHGHGDAERSILNPAARRSLREFSGIDGAFVVRGDGLILAGGRYLQAVAPPDAVPAGLGARHRAAAGIAAATRCLAFTVSESTGDARVFGGGRILMTIERND